MPVGVRAAEDNDIAFGVFDRVRDPGLFSGFLAKVKLLGQGTEQEVDNNENGQELQCLQCGISNFPLHILKLKVYKLAIAEHAQIEDQKYKNAIGPHTDIFVFVF